VHDALKPAPFQEQTDVDGMAVGQNSAAGAFELVRPPTPHNLAAAGSGGVAGAIFRNF
jgi:hypothetical protein